MAYGWPIDSRHNENWTIQPEKDWHTEATAQTDTKIYRDVNVSTQIVREQNDRYDPYHQTYDQQSEAIVQTDYDSKDVLIGGDTPLPTSRGLAKVTTSNQYYRKSPYEELQPMPRKRTFKLDLSGVRAHEDKFDFVDDDEVLTEGDSVSSYHGVIPSNIYTYMYELLLFLKNDELSID